MNVLRGVIKSVESAQFVSIVEVESGGALLSALALETPDQADYLRSGTEVELIFKENETAVAVGLSGEISLRNRVRAPIKQIRRKTLFADVTFDYQGVEVTATITTSSVERMGLREGLEAEWLVKTHEMAIKSLGGCCSGGGMHG